MTNEEIIALVEMTNEEIIALVERFENAVDNNTCEIVAWHSSANIDAAAAELVAARQALLDAVLL